MGFAFLPWEKLPPKYQGLPFMILGILLIINAIAEKRLHWLYMVSGLALIAIGPIVFFGIRAEEMAKLETEED
jgi:uncharacterized membrane protein HdeD (DUF308 family)